MDYRPEQDAPMFSISYSDLRERYVGFCALSDDEFVSRLPEIIHFACIVCWFKEIPSSYCLSDVGVIHELAHLLHIPDYSMGQLDDTRAIQTRS